MKTVIGDRSRRIDQDKPRLYAVAYNLVRYGLDKGVIRGIVTQAMADASRDAKKDGF